MSIRQATLHENAAASLPAGTLLQRKCACGSHTSGEEECDQCKRMQRRAASADGDEFEIPPIVGTVLASPGRPLDAQVRQQMEAGFGHDFHDVRVHTDATAQRSARSVNALAYTVGRNVVFGGGQYQPGSQHGMHLLAHELAHVVQQRGHIGGAGVVGSGNAFLEHAADSAADRVVRGQVAPSPGVAPRAMLARQPVPGDSFDTRSPGPCIGESRSSSNPQSSQNNAADRKSATSKDGQRYIVERKRWTDSSMKPETRTSTKPGIDTKQIWLDFAWCRGSSKGTVRAAANVPEAAVKLVRDTIANGGDVGKAWDSAAVSPSLSVSLRINTFELKVGGSITISTGGDVQSGGGKIGMSGGKIPKGWEFGAYGQGDSFGGHGGLYAERRLGEEPPPEKCEKEWVRTGYDYTCYRLDDVPAHTSPGEQRVNVSDEHDLNLFFVYEQDKFEDASNLDALEKLRAHLREGFQIYRVEGWASPEGPLDLSNAAKPKTEILSKRTSEYTDNRKLSERRAVVTAKMVSNDLCSSGASCFTSDVVIVGMGERMNPLDPVSGEPKDIRGAALEKHVDTQFAADQREASVRSPELMADLSKTRSRKRRVEMIYPQLRRAVLRLRRNRSVTQPCEVAVPATTKETGIKCSAEILKSAFPDRAGGL